jgi:hypothetical protein
VFIPKQFYKLRILYVGFPRGKIYIIYNDNQVELAVDVSFYIRSAGNALVSYTTLIKSAKWKGAHQKRIHIFQIRSLQSRNSLAVISTAINPTLIIMHSPPLHMATIIFPCTLFKIITVITADPMIRSVHTIIFIGRASIFFSRVHCLCFPQPHHSSSDEFICASYSCQFCFQPAIFSPILTICS